MNATIQSMPTMIGPAYIRSACVIRAAGDHLYRVRLEGQGEITARVAVPLTGALAPGDGVLVAGESPTSGYIIGLLNSERQLTLRTSQGAGARLQAEDGEESIAVHDDHNRILFEYFPAQSKSVVHAPEGDLKLAAPNGRIDLQSAEGIQCRSKGDVSLRSEGSVRMTAAGDDNADQDLCLDKDGARLGVHRLSLTAGQGDISILRATYEGRQLHSHIDRAKLVYDKLETRARKIWQTSGYLFKQVRNLWQTRAGRMRTMVDGSLHSQSGNATLIAKEDVRIDGKKINLG